MNTTTSVLGSILFEPLQITIYSQKDAHRGRERFTLAHELAHHLLNHAQYLRRESCDEEDFLRGNYRLDDNSTDIARLEFQANYFASNLLMPRMHFIADFQLSARNLNITNRGFGTLYVDNQPCNIMNYESVTSRLMHIYGVSRTAVKIRLEGLGLLHKGLHT